MPNTIAENLQRLVNARTAIASAITAKGGTVNTGDGFEAFPADIATIPSGGGGGADAGKPVRFIDYDGSIVDSYTAAEFAELSAMPSNPSHEGLTAQGWNWSLADAKAYVAKYGRLNVGQMYITSDGKTRIKIKLEEGRLSPVLGLGINGTVDVDWGDDTAHGTMEGSNVSTLVQLQHVYAAAGEYTIALTVTGSMSFLGDSTYSAAILRKANVAGGTVNESRVYQNAVHELYIGNGVTSIGDYTFYYCYSLASVTIPDSVTSIGSCAFLSCYSLASVTIPDSVTSIGSSAFYYCCGLASVTIPGSVTSIGDHAFYYCYSLASVTIPDSVTSIGDYTFYDCYSLASVTIPDSVTSIGVYAFYYCCGLAFIKFTSYTPPTAGTRNYQVFDIPTDCIIYVPTGRLNSYKNKTNYPKPDVYTYIEY